VAADVIHVIEHGRIVESGSHRELLANSRPAFPTVAVPTGIAVFPKEIVPPVRRWCEQGYSDIGHWTEMPRGGRFAATEQPAVFVEDLRTFFRPLR
jgi:hypothetical protein